MKLKAIYATKDEIPEGFDSLFTERDGKFELTGIDGIKTQADVDRLNEANRKEREEHKATKAKLRAWGDRTPESFEELEAERDELKARVEAGSGRLTDEQLDAIVEKRLPARLRPLQREIENLKRENGELKGTLSSFETKENRRTVIDAVHDAARGDKRVPIAEVAMPDVEILAERVLEVRDGRAIVSEAAQSLGFTPGVSARDWLTDVQASGKRPHWFAQNVGAGAGGGEVNSGAAGENPFSKETFNLTKIGQLIKVDPQKAKRFALAAKRADLLPAELRG